ncbi:hypothetical protein PVAP13_5NG564900 [Panicum virgatum]|uniref:Tudor-knot domain-containing protein n=1 Tax=Panicum virgatum TaxID=38727 RepID=A0A8T0S687_PANVG|nr:hypothetical protein PVAP13_5NG564900 [Panicum virgatum]
MERRLWSSAASSSWAAHLLLEVCTRVMCRWCGQKLHPVKVIECRKGSSSSSPTDYKYYVHYTECKDPPCLASQSHQEVSCLGLGFGLLQIWGNLDFTAHWSIGCRAIQFRPFCDELSFQFSFLCTFQQ